MRLDKFVCGCTELVRAQAKRAIGKGQVTVNGVLTKNAAAQVTADCRVEYDGRRLVLSGPRYIMLHKPLDTVCTALADDARSVFGLLDLSKRETLHIAGRLDVDTSGLLLITDDGAWSHRLTAPKKHCGKTYRVELAEPVSADAIAQFKQGVLLHGEQEPTRPAELVQLTPTEVLLTLHEGKYHQVKRMFAALNNRVVRLHREQIGSIRLDENLAPGDWRFLTEQEISCS